MVQARYVVSDKVVGIGLRVFITSFLMDSGFKKGVARNISEKKVEVLVDLLAADPKSFREQLETGIHKGFKSVNPNYDPKKIDVKLMEIKNPGWDIPTLMFSSQSLLLDQTGKGVNVMIQVRDAIKDLPKKIAVAMS